MTAARAVPCQGPADAPWVLFFHGFGGSGDTWLKQIDDYSLQYNLLLFNFHEQGSTSGLLPLETKPFVKSIADAMNLRGIQKAHVVCLSSGSLAALAFAALYPERTRSVVLAGGMISFDLRTNFLLAVARALQNAVPYMFLYRFFAYVIMPGIRHRKSRGIFVREAEKMGHDEFCRWINFLPLLKDNKAFLSRINNNRLCIPFLYIMGSNDYLFRKAVTRDAAKLNNAAVAVIPNCGHVCSIEKAESFNRLSLEFLQKATH